MKKMILLIAMLASFATTAQKKSKTVSKNNPSIFIITESTFNGQDHTSFDIERGGYFTFIKNEKGELILYNVAMEYEKMYSYGKVLDIKYETIDETEKTYKAEEFKFRWKYYNTYDKNTGYATINFTKVFKPQGTSFILKMVLANLDVFEYKGYVKDSEREATENVTNNNNEYQY